MGTVSDDRLGGRLLSTRSGLLEFGCELAAYAESMTCIADSVRRHVRGDRYCILLRQNTVLADIANFILFVYPDGRRRRFSQRKLQICGIFAVIQTYLAHVVSMYFHGVK